MLPIGRVVLAHGMGQAYKNVRTRAVAVERGGDGLPLLLAHDRPAPQTARDFLAGFEAPDLPLLGGWTRRATSITSKHHGARVRHNPTAATSSQGSRAR